MFCILKVALLHGKSVGFASQKSRFRNAKTQLLLFNRIIFTKQGRFQHYLVNNEKEFVPTIKNLAAILFCAPFLMFNKY
ncbi:hypothetical protein CUC04_02380 [Prevotella intermedia]|uniref:Uncharacterized protein n=1 Tax=Prevotella intermedia TaxID=28131 RepID=A0A2G9IFK4_PREIN|nr:hypothetical protein CUC04_02380 [Prevotella intermedia]